MTAIIFISIISFLIGGIPFGLLISKLYNIDIRNIGSKNIGATNVFRSVGKIPGIITFLLDFFKGAIIVILVRQLGFDLYYQSMFGFLSVLGHCYSPFLKGKGGKGVSTGFSVFLFICPVIAIYSLLIFITTFIFSGIISISSLTAVLFLYLMSLNSDNSNIISTFTLLTFLLVTFKHRENIKRILNGEERRFRKIGL